MGFEKKEAVMGGNLHSKLAGSWYSADKSELESQMKEFFAAAPDRGSDDVVALLLPHAGYAYSGAVAAAGLNQVKGRKFKRVIVLGPTHRVAMKNTLSVPPHATYSTPLGETPLDIEVIRELRGSPMFTVNAQAHELEHSVQIELPLLQYALGEFELVPIVVGQLDAEGAAKAAAAILKIVDADTLVVVSSDFTHYGANYGYLPFQGGDVAGKIKDLDMGALAEIKKLNAKGFLAYVEKTGATICGRSGIAVLLSMLPENSRVEMMDYDTSGRMLGDSSNSVSYLSAAFSGEWPGKTKPAVAKKDILSADDKKRLLELAEKSLIYCLKNRRPATPEALGIEISPAMKKEMGAFVTLHKNGRLRGCIGEIIPTRPLYEAVMDQAVNAGLRDPRFPAVSMDEIGDIEFEISALTPPEPVESYRDIIIGEHGMVLRKAGRSAVFLPQVAPEQGWGLAETLSHLAMKGGLPPDAWRDGAEFTVFEAIVFDNGRNN